jgi:radical SAM-linked protein
MCAETALPDPETSLLGRFEDLLSGTVSDKASLDSILDEILKSPCMERALMLLKHHPPFSKEQRESWHAVRTRLEHAIALERAKRMNRWQHDPHRRTLRIRFHVQGSACELNPPALQAALAKAFHDAGLPVAMGLEKMPRPAVHLGHPLPRSMEGRAEWADVVLDEQAPMKPCEIPERINVHCREGLSVLECAYVPNHSSPVLDLCCEAHWSWTCPQEWLDHAKARLDAFVQADTWEIQKMGKQDGQKQVKRLQVRHLVRSLAWNGDILLFSTSIAPNEALNPQKLLAGILDVEAATVQGIIRLRVDLAEDPKLKEPDRYAPKLHNIYEDAVLLEAGGNITLVQEDEEETLLINKAQSHTLK